MAMDKTRPQKKPSVHSYRWQTRLEIDWSPSHWSPSLVGDKDGAGARGTADEAACPAPRQELGQNLGQRFAASHAQDLAVAGQQQAGVHRMATPGARHLSAKGSGRRLKCEKEGGGWRSGAPRSIQ